MRDEVPGVSVGGTGLGQGDLVRDVCGSPGEGDRRSPRAVA